MLLYKKQNKTEQKKSLFQFSLLIFSCFSTHSCLIFSLSNLSISCLKRIPKIYLLITQCSVHLEPTLYILHNVLFSSGGKKQDEWYMFSSYICTSGPENGLCDLGQAVVFAPSATTNSLFTY